MYLFDLTPKAKHNFSCFIPGVYALKGKPLNVRDVTAVQLANNKEFSELKNCLGLKTGKVYKDVKDLRYGAVAIMSDSDVDGVGITLKHTICRTQVEISYQVIAQSA